MVMDLVMMMAFPLAATVLAWILNLNFVAATLLYFASIGIYLSWRRPKLIEKTVKFVALTAVPFWVIFDYLAYADWAWFVPNSLFRFLRGSLPIEDLIWSVVWMYAVIMWWEYFVDKGKDRPKFSKNIKYLMFILTALSIIFGLLYFVAPNWLYFPYFYLKFGLVFVIFPMIVALWHSRKLIRKLVPLGIYFFMVSALSEWVALTHNHWFFGGAHYILKLNVWGTVLPLDEILFWWVLAAPSLICWYEMFADDWK